MPNQREARLREFAQLLSRRMNELRDKRPDCIIYEAADRIPSIIWTADGNGVVNYLSRRYYDLMGVDHLDWASLLHPDERQGYLDAWNMAVRTGKDFTASGRFRDSSGKYHYLVTHGTPTFCANGRVLYWIGSSVQLWDTIAPVSQVA